MRRVDRLPKQHSRGANMNVRPPNLATPVDAPIVRPFAMLRLVRRATEQQGYGNLGIARDVWK